MEDGTRVPIRKRIAVLLAVFCALAVPVLFLADYLRGSRAFPASSDGACRVHNYAASQYVAYSYLFGHKVAERRLSQIVSRQPIVTGYRLQGNASDLVFTFQPGTWGTWPAPENHWLIYTLSPVFTVSFFLFMIYPLPTTAIMFLRRTEQTGRMFFSGLFAIAVVPATTVLLIRFGLCASLWGDLFVGAIIAVATGALFMIRPNARTMAAITILFQAAAVTLLLVSPL